MNSKAKGERSEIIIIASLVKKGFSVSLPFGNNQRYDLILDDGENLFKIQCKTGILKRGCVIFKTCSTNGFTHKQKTYKGQIDFFMVYCPQNNKIYKIPIDICSIRTFTLRIDKPQKRIKNIHWAHNYEFDLG